MEIDILGIDLAKNVFQLHGADRKGRVVLKRRVMREQLISVVTEVPPCTIAIEACTGAFYWARRFEVLGHQVKIISPQYVKPFVRRQKNDGNDAEAIVTAARQPHIPLVRQVDYPGTAHHPGADCRYKQCVDADGPHDACRTVGPHVRSGSSDPRPGQQDRCRIQG